MLTVKMLQAETLVEKNRRKRQAKCEHDEVFSSTCTGPAGTFTTQVCLDCGKTWRTEERRLIDERTMTLKMNMREVRLASTGKHLFDAPYCYQSKVPAGDDLTIELGERAYFTPRELSEAEKEQFLKNIETLNAAQEKAWGINQPIREQT